MERIPRVTPESPTCPYCSQPASLKDAAEVYHGRAKGKLWHCSPCEAWGKADPESHKPIGTLANRELRKHRQAANLYFDDLWRRRHLHRNQAYALLRKWTGKTHIGFLDGEECAQLIKHIKEWKAQRLS